MIHIEHKKEVFLLRGGPEFKSYGDPYTYSMVITEERNGTVAYIECLCKNGIEPLTRVEWKAVTDELKAIGFLKMKFSRIKNGLTRHVLKELD